MKKLIYLFTLLIIFTSCNPDDSLTDLDIQDDNLIERYTYDEDGVVFKITNDINNLDYVSLNNDSSNIEFDFVYFGKFDYVYDYYNLISDLNIKTSFTTIPYGKYVHWRYNYDNIKNITILHNLNLNGSTVFFYNMKFDYFEDDVYEELFPLPVNDTVHVSVNKLMKYIIDNR